MTDSGLLAHLRDSFFVPPENLATEALAYILNSSDTARETWNRFVRRIQPDLPEIRSFVTQVTAVDDAGIPDLVGLAKGGTQQFVGEMKFEAGLTSNQPVTYIRRLQVTQQPGLLLFVVPEQRIERVWSEVRRRCSRAGIELAPNHSASRLEHSALTENVTVAVTSWYETLTFLEDALVNDENGKALWELRQLQTMCRRQEREAFVPLTARDLDERIGQRIKEYVSLVFEVAEDVLVADNTVGLRGFARASSSVYSGRYIRIAGWQCFLQVNWEYWSTLRPTPIWLEMNSPGARGYTPLSDAMSPLLAELPSRMITIDGWRQVIPIYLKEGVTRDEVRDDMAQQIREVAALMQLAPMPNAAAPASQDDQEV